MKFEKKSRKIKISLCNLNPFFQRILITWNLQFLFLSFNHVHPKYHSMFFGFLFPFVFHISTLSLYSWQSYDSCIVSTKAIWLVAMIHMIVMWYLFGSRSRYMIGQFDSLSDFGPMWVQWQTSNDFGSPFLSLDYLFIWCIFGFSFPPYRLQISYLFIWKYQLKKIVNKICMYLSFILCDVFFFWFSYV